MKIDVKVTLTDKEVYDALTEYLRHKTRYDYRSPLLGKVVTGLRFEDGIPIEVFLGDAPEEVEEIPTAPPIEAPTTDTNAAATTAA